MSCRHEGRGNYIHLNRGLAYVFTSSCSLCDRLHLRLEIWPNNRKIYPHFPCELRWVVRRVQKQRSTTEPKVVDSFPLCKGSRGLLSNSEMCFDSFWSWKHTRGLPLCLLRGQGCRHTVLKWKAKQGCFSAKCFSTSPPGHCSNCQKVEPLIHISPPTRFLFLSNL